MELVRSMVKVLEEKKGENILLLDISGISDFTDYFVICSGASPRTLDALADSVIREGRKKYHYKGKLEGTSADGWIVGDFGDVVLHIFSQERREYYRLEELWDKGTILLHLQ